MILETDMKDAACHCAIISIFGLLLNVFHTKVASAGKNLNSLDVQMPPSHIALSGDLHIHITSSSFPPLLLQLSRLEGDTTKTLTTFPVLPEARALSLNKTVVKVPCGYFSKGGLYYVLLKKQPIGVSTNSSADDSGSVITRSLDVRWPMPQLSLTPEHVQTYPESSVMAILEFPDVVCTPKIESPAAAIPEFWLELHFCGSTLLTCDNSFSVNETKLQALYSDQVRGFPGRRVITLRCELFGLAGHYALFLRPTAPAPPLPHTVAYIKADWSEQFVFNVVPSSIFPCDPHSGGVRVLFQYPSCILESGDRVRLYARLRANVASLAPPSSLEYVTEQRVIRGHHSLNFECDLFTEYYIEYCFVYVSQAISGAVADVRMDCVPTLPVTDSDKGGWGPWSEWTPCSSTCIGGTRTRHRFCDSPPPRYGAKFCEGPMVETEKCNTNSETLWKCLYGNGISNNNIAAEMPEVEAEVGEKCKCGCFLHLSETKPKRLVAASSLSCPGRLLWQIRADKGYIIQFTVEQFHLPCGTQWLKVRDGSSLSANLLADLSGSPDTTPSIVNSTGPDLILEFVANEMFSGMQVCGGGFLAHAMQIKNDKANVTEVPIAQEIGVLPAAVLKLTAVHIAAIFFTSGLIIATVLLGVQYLVRYRKYHIAQADDQDSLAGVNASCSSLQVRTRASSNTTLLSEVISLTRFKPNIIVRNKHSRLRESVEYEHQGNEQEVTLAKEEEFLSEGSTETLTHQDSVTTGSVPAVTEEVCFSEPISPRQSDEPTPRRLSLSSEKDKLQEKDMDQKGVRLSRRFSNGSTATLTNGCYSPATSIISRATIRSTNVKECKDKRNRERLLAGPVGSDFSLTGQDVDLEMDYYDYNVVNAGAAPGSYLGMDPAFLVWIPPLDESGEILQDIDKDHEMVNMIRPRQYVDPGSNKESPEEELLLPKVSRQEDKRNVVIKRRHPDNKTDSNESVGSGYEKVPLMSNNDHNKGVSIQLQEFPKAKLVLNKEKLAKEKETRVEKSPSVDSNPLDDIKFVDDDDEENETTDNQCNIEISYQDSNILSFS